MPSRTSPSELLRRARIELVLPGYPARAFEEEGEIEAHVGGDRLVCLMCGKEYQAVILHVRRTHQMSEADYRLTFNIPTKFALTGRAFSEKRRTVATRPKHVEMIRGRRPKNPKTREMCELAARHRSERIWASRRENGG